MRGVRQTCAKFPQSEHGHQSALAGPAAGCGALGEERRACTNSAARLCSSSVTGLIMMRGFDSAMYHYSVI